MPCSKKLAKWAQDYLVKWRRSVFKNCIHLWRGECWFIILISTDLETMGRLFLPLWCNDIIININTAYCIVWPHIIFFKGTLKSKRSFSLKAHRWGRNQWMSLKQYSSSRLWKHVKKSSEFLRQVSFCQTCSCSFKHLSFWKRGSFSVTHGWSGQCHVEYELKYF